MKIEIPYIYWINAVVGRKRNPEPLNYLGVVEIDVPEVTSDTAPVAVAWESPNSADRPQAVRFYDGGFVVPASKLQRDAAAFPASVMADLSKTTELAVDGIAYGLGYAVGSPQWHDLKKYVVGSPKDQPLVKDIKTLVESNEEQAKADAEAFAAGLVSIDGLLFRRVEEPVIAVSHQMDNGTPIVSLSVHTGSRRYGGVFDLEKGVQVGDPMNTRFFPIGETDTAEDAALSTGVEVRKQFLSEPRVSIPSVFKFDREYEAAVRTAEYAVEGIRPILAKYDRPTIECWVGIRERFEEYLRTGDRDIVEDLASEALPQLYELVGRTDASIASAIEAGLGDWGEGTISIAMFGEAPRP